MTKIILGTGAYTIMNKQTTQLYCHTCDFKITEPKNHKGHEVSMIITFGHISITKTVSKFNFRKVREQTIRDTVFERDGHKCLLCFSKDNLTIDHIKAQARGGAKLWIENQQSLCLRCNGWKATKHIDFIHPESPKWWEKTKYKNQILQFRKENIPPQEFKVVGKIELPEGYYKPNGKLQKSKKTKHLKIGLEHVHGDKKDEISPLVLEACEKVKHISIPIRMSTEQAEWLKKRFGEDMMSKNLKEHLEFRKGLEK